METYIWLDEHINSEENKNYIIELELIYQIKVNTCENINEAIFYLKKYKFKETKIIISGKLYDDFVKIFKEKITEIYVVPKIIVFARYKNQFFKIILIFTILIMNFIVSVELLINLMILKNF